MPPGSPRWWGRTTFGQRFAARTSWEALSGASESPNLGCAERKVKFLVVTQLLDNSRVICKGDDSVNTVPRIRPGLIRRKALGKNSVVQVFVFFMPSVRLLRRAFVAGARLALVRQRAERPCDRGAVARQTEDDWRLLGAVEGN